VNDDTEKSDEKLQELNNGTVTGAHYMFWLVSLVQQTVAPILLDVLSKLYLPPGPHSLVEKPSNCASPVLPMC
jgi:hypothetical protein